MACVLLKREEVWRRGGSRFTWVGGRRIIFKAFGGVFFSPVCRSSFVVPFLLLLLAFVVFGEPFGRLFVTF